MDWVLAVVKSSSHEPVEYPVNAEENVEVFETVFADEVRAYTKGHLRRCSPSLMPVCSSVASLGCIVTLGNADGWLLLERMLVRAS